MKIERSRFLVLTAAMAAASAASYACTVTNNTAADGGGGGGGDAGGGDGSSGSDGSSALDGGGSDGGGSDGGAGDSATACNDNVIDGGASSCSSLGPDSGLDGGCGADPRANGFCTALQTNLKPAIAEMAIQCFKIAPACEGIDDCLTTALAAACADPTAAAACQSMQTACDDAGVEAGTGLDAGTFASDCAQIVSGLTAAGRAAFATCYDQGGCASLQACAPPLAQ